MGHRAWEDMEGIEIWEQKGQGGQEGQEGQGGQGRQGRQGGQGEYSNTMPYAPCPLIANSPTHS